MRGLQGLAGLRGDAPSEARGVDGERAGRPRTARRSGRPRAARRSGGVRRAKLVGMEVAVPVVMVARSEGCEACGGCICGAEGRRPDRRGVRGLQGLAGLRGDAPSEARGVDGERAGRPRAAREVWRGAPHGGLAAGCLADGERAGRRPPAHRADADNRTCWA